MMKGTPYFDADTEDEKVVNDSFKYAAFFVVVIIYEDMILIQTL